MRPNHRHDDTQPQAPFDRPHNGRLSPRQPRAVLCRLATAIAGAGLMSLALAAGCSQVSRPDQARLGEQVDPDAFLHEHLQKEPVVTVAEAYRAMVMLAEGQDKYNSFAAREEYLLQKNILRPAWKLQRDDAIDRGSVAYMVLEILKVRGGVNMNVYGRLLGVADRRYAGRELAYIRIMEDRPAYRLISGAELVDVLGNADPYMAERGLYEDTHTDVVETVLTPATTQ